jgi:hypothetical protein
MESLLEFFVRVDNFAKPFCPIWSNICSAAGQSSAAERDHNLSVK